MIFVFWNLFSIGPNDLKFCRHGGVYISSMPAKFQIIRTNRKKVMAKWWNPPTPRVLTCFWDILAHWLTKSVITRLIPKKWLIWHYYPKVEYKIWIYRPVPGSKTRNSWSYTKSREEVVESTTATHNRVNCMK